MKQYNKLESAEAAARRHVERYGGGAAVVQSDDLPNMYLVGTVHEVRRMSRQSKLTTCRMFYGITGRRHQTDPNQSKPVLSLEAALLPERS